MPNIQHNIAIICEIHIGYGYIDPSNLHNFENYLLPWYSHQSCLGWPLAAWLAQAALREKSWNDNFQSYGLTIVGNFLHFWSLARHKTKFQISCETCKTARLGEFLLLVLGFGGPTKGKTRIWGHFVILDGCECVILRTQIMLRFQLENVVKNSLQNYFTFENSKFFWIKDMKKITKKDLFGAENFWDKKNEGRIFAKPFWNVH